MNLVENTPLDTQVIEDLISNRQDLYLVWPAAKWPFDHQQWRDVLDGSAGNKSFLVYEGDQLIGHAALRAGEEPGVYKVSFLYLLLQLRSKGLGRTVVALLEEYARENMSAEKLVLVVRSYNPAAIKCYLKCGFQEYSREETLIKMSKLLSGG
jgi:ribosomal protein S18 acetylase RimI-like enzyme